MNDKRLAFQVGVVVFAAACLAAVYRAGRLDRPRLTPFGAPIPARAHVDAGARSARCVGGHIPLAGDLTREIAERRGVGEGELHLAEAHPVARLDRGRLARAPLTDRLTAHTGDG